MLESNKLVLETPYYRRLTDSQLRQIHNASLEVMERVGIRFYDEQALRLLKSGGAEITDGNRVYIPSWRVEWALSIAPKQIILYDQNGKASIRLSGRKSYFGNGSDLLHVIDHRTGTRRTAILQDVRDLIRLLDALPHYDFVMSGFVPSDIPVEKAELFQTLAMLENTCKPIINVTTNLANAVDEIAMFEAVAGGANEFKRRPFAANYINMTHPLRHNPEAIQKLLYLAEKGLPAIYRPSVVTRGLSTPITAPGFLAVNNASCLAGLVLSQLKKEGAPFIRDSSAGGTFDMRTMVGLHCAPEVRGFNEELAHFYNLPCFGIGGTSASKTVDQQAAMEAALTLITSTLAGAQLIHDVGYMESGVTTSLIQVMICHEIIAWIKHYMNGLVINEESLALDVVEEVGPDGNFLDTGHTLRHFKEDEYPELRDHQRYENWFAGGEIILVDRAREKVGKILAEHQPRQLEKEVTKALQKTVGK
jgi:trimethylamine--corrinoid protein Co-methyltransferase